MRLLKLLAYCALGYFIYELWQGMSERSSLAAGNGPLAESDLDRALNEDVGRMQNMTGTGRGTLVETEDVQGMTVPHVVGRGVVTR